MKIFQNIIIILRFASIIRTNKILEKS